MPRFKVLRAITLIDVAKRVWAARRVKPWGCVVLRVGERSEIGSSTESMDCKPVTIDWRWVMAHGMPSGMPWSVDHGMHSKYQGFRAPGFDPEPLGKPEWPAITAEVTELRGAKNGDLTPSGILRP